MRFVVVLLIILTPFIPLFGFQWPAEDIVLVSTFGESKFDSFLKGIDLAGTSQDIHPVASGELVFYYTRGESQMDLSSGLGTYTVYQHKNGIRTLYGHLQEGSIKPEKISVTEDDVIGRMGSSGNAVETSLHLQVIDTEFEKYINPLLSFPLLDDDSDPKIDNVYLITEDGQSVLTSDSVIHSGVFGISAEIYDLSEDAGYYCPVSPFSISLYINGENLANFNLESLGERDGEIVLQGADRGISYSSLYRSQWEYFLGEFELNQGDAIIEISVKDFSGNEGIKIIPLKVRE